MKFIQSVSAWVLLKITIPVGLRPERYPETLEDFKLRRYIEEKLGRLAIIMPEFLK